MSTRPRESMSYREVLGEIDSEQARAELDQFGRDSRYLSSIRSQLREEHPESWVAVYKEAVAAVGAELSEVFSALAEKGIPKNLAALKFITKEPQRLPVRPGRFTGQRELSNRVQQTTTAGSCLGIV